MPDLRQPRYDNTRKAWIVEENNGLVHIFDDMFEAQTYYDENYKPQQPRKGETSW